MNQNTTYDNFKSFLNDKSNIYLDTIKYNANSKTLHLTLVPNQIIEKEKLYNLKLSINESLPFVNDVLINTVYKEISDDIEKYILDYWDNILYEIKIKSPSMLGWLKNCKRAYDSSRQILEICVDNSVGLENLNIKKCNKLIEDIYKNDFNKRIKVNFKILESDNSNSYNNEKEKELNSILSKIMSQSSKPSEKQNKDKEKKPKNKNIFGKKINGEIVRIKGLSEEDGMVCIEGKVFEKESRELKSGKILITLSITDYTSSIGVKIFVSKDDAKQLDENIQKGSYYRIRGAVRYDTFEKETVIMARDINISDLEDKVRMDNSKEKRVELHAHTKMSSMDGVCSASDLIKRASQWGHKAIAITDHGVVQAYPDAISASKKYGIKVIYGIEGYIINDGSLLVQNSKGQSLDDTYIVFDIETTGLSFKHDKITEIGAVKINNGKIIDKFSALINPEVKIPGKIVELTGITDAMVKDKPTINEVLPKFLDFIDDNPVVAHNASFDTSFIKENCKRLGREFNNTIVDTLSLSRILVPNLKRYKLNVLAKHFKVNLENHHRAVDDAVATGEIFINLISLLKEKNINTLDDVNNLLSDKVDYTKLDTYHINILVKNYRGLKNLYKLVTHSHLETFYKRPRIPKSMLEGMREGLIIGTACEAGELYRAILNNKNEDDIKDIVKFYDFLEIQPLENNGFMIEKGIVKNYDDLKEINKKILDLGKKYNKPVVATGDVHFLDPHDAILRTILMTGQGYSDADNQPPIYFKTTEEMLNDFSYLGEETAYDVVVKNPNMIADSIENIIPIPEETYPPKIEGADEDLRNMCYKKAKSIYGDPLPEIVQRRLDRELSSIISNGYAVMYIIAQKLVTKSLKDGYLVGSRGSVGSSFVATMSDITEVNPLAPHYVCPNCKSSEFITDGSYESGADLPDKTCPNCGTKYNKDGHAIPFETFLGFEGDKEPDIDLNFAGEYQSVAHKYTEELFGTGYVFRAGTIGTIADKTAFGFAKKYFEEKNITVSSREILRLSSGCTGVKRTTGQHPGGIMVVPNYKEVHDFTPVQYPANDKSSGVITTHFDYHAISGRLLKLDILGHDVPTIIKMLEELTDIDPQSIPLDDESTVKIFTSTEPLKLVDEDFDIEVGSLGIPEFGTKFVRQMLIDTQPTTFAELVRISGLSHGTDVWLNNAQELVRQGTAQLKNVISTRDDIMNYLILKGLPPKAAFTIMEKVRKGKGLTPEHEKLMNEHNVPKWYIESCKKIKYMFPKAHAVAYVMMSFRIAYFKVHYPLAFYSTYFSTKVDDFDADLICRGKETVLNKIKELSELGNNATQKEKDLLTVLEVAYEMYCRGFSFLKVDLYESDSDKFLIKNNSILPPLRALQGVGENAAKKIAEESRKSEFLSIEDIRLRTKISKTVIETLDKHGCLKDLPQSNQLSLFQVI
ncbi:PolC-type DNA polymerase III [Paramaledivibacter caminithermalis]|jgi:DNA polymerase-3 subunit alpha (Gram-positive type)|uniref:DNA polymerase III PolC-type n=1 Tax=Paramaledivibacter caminithermalis (strain DSM 15212 / CIP 107654 / DViRD3) TaxID=1121301 RepID=A0A1M6N5M4_PARC5|nr:PolC-type DNA polymerase III [Paramaledivibacter caminithermalis]SHJ90999.1 DNA polymerase III catalytic subunit, PolC type [Paramaledivibacter caminithermalis DSM 15212]